MIFSTKASQERKLYHLDTGWACGGVWVKNGLVVDGAPIFRKFKGEELEKLARIYKVVAA